MVQERLYGIHPKTRVFGQARKRGFDILAGERLIFAMHQSPPAQLARTTVFRPGLSGGVKID